MLTNPKLSDAFGSYAQNCISHTNDSDCAIFAKCTSVHRFSCTMHCSTRIDDTSPNPFADRKSTDAFECNSHFKSRFFKLDSDRLNGVRVYGNHVRGGFAFILAISEPFWKISGLKRELHSNAPVDFWSGNGFELISTVRVERCIPFKNRCTNALFRFFAQFFSLYGRFRFACNSGMHCSITDLSISKRWARWMPHLCASLTSVHALHRMQSRFPSFKLADFQSDLQSKICMQFKFYVYIWIRKQNSNRSASL